PLEAVKRHVGAVRALASKMIEVQNDRIALPAVDTWMSRQVLPHTELVFGGMLVSQHPHVSDVLLAVLQVPDTLVFHVAGLAPRLADPSLAILEAEFFDRIFDA